MNHPLDLRSPRPAPMLLAMLPMALPVQERPVVDPDVRFRSLEGAYTVTAQLWPAPDAEPIEATGTATWLPSHGGRHVHESFELRARGETLRGDAWITWRPRAQRYELTQIDGFSDATHWLVGSWDADAHRVVLHDLEEVRPEGRPALRQEYAFEGGGFVKEIRLRDEDGAWWLAARHRYRSVERPAPGVTEVHGVVEVPLHGASGWVELDVFLHGEGPFRMILDTGAGTTVLHADLVRELGLASRGVTHIGDPSDPHANEVDVLLLDEVMVGDALFYDVEAVGWGEQPLVPRSDIRGILGVPTFADCLLTLDYPARTVRVEPGALPEPDGEHVLPMTMHGIPSFPIRVAGHELEAHLDAGNASSLVLPPTWQPRLPLVEGTLRTGRGHRASGPVEFTIATLDGLVQLGGHAFERPPVRFDPGLELANVGYDLLRGLVITLDQRNGRLRLTAPDDVLDGD